MNTKPLVSIITITYNNESFIRQCIESVINQIYKNWEMIIIDDYSRDKTCKLAKEYASSDVRITVIEHKKRWGIERLQDSYNQALTLCRGDFIAILEGDDYWPKNKLEIQIGCMNDKVILSYGNVTFVDYIGRNILLKSYDRKDRRLDNINFSLLQQYATLDFFISPVTIVIKKSTS